MTLRVCDLTTQPTCASSLGDGAPFRLSGISFQLRVGERLAVLGANGSGKSTLLKALLGHVPLNCGSVWLDDDSGAGRCEAIGADCWRAPFAYVGQDPDSSFVCQTVEDEVSFALCNASLTKGQVHERVDRALERCGIASLRSRGVAELSGGQKQLVSLAAVVAVNPRVLLLDEPFSMLDETHRCQMLAVIETVSQDSCVVHVTHRADDVERCDRVVALEGGRVAWNGNADDFLQTPGLAERFGLRDQRIDSLSCSYGQRFASAGWSVVEMWDLPGEATASSCAASLAADIESYRPGRSGVFSRQAFRAAGSEDSGFELAGMAVRVSSGELVLLAGEPGSGKTTLSCMLAGLLRPQKGSVSLSGSPVEPGEVGLAFQRVEDQLFKPTVLKDVAFGPMNRGMQQPQALQLASECLAAVGLDPQAFAQRNPLCLSGGQKRRAAIAGVIALRSAYIVLDEPTVGLDAFGAAALLDLIAKLLEEGRGLVVATHEPQTFFSLASRAYVLERGRIKAVYVKGRGGLR